MSFESKCIRCGGTEMEPGSIQSTGKLHFRPANLRFLTMQTGDISVNANVCIACGYVELVAETRKLASLTERARPF